MGCLNLLSRAAGTLRESPNSYVKRKNAFRDLPRPAQGSKPIKQNAPARNWGARRQRNTKARKNVEKKIKAELRNTWLMRKLYPRLFEKVRHFPDTFYF